MQRNSGVQKSRDQKARWVETDRKKWEPVRECSGGHLNPAVSIGLLFSNKISVMKFLAYVPMQMLGAITGAALVKAIHPSAYVSAGGGANGVGPGLTMAGTWGLETISTFILVFTVLNATDGVRYASVAHLPVRSFNSRVVPVFLQ